MDPRGYSHVVHKLSTNDCFAESGARRSSHSTHAGIRRAFRAIGDLLRGARRHDSAVVSAGSLGSTSAISTNVSCDGQFGSTTRMRMSPRQIQDLLLVLLNYS